MGPVAPFFDFSKGMRSVVPLPALSMYRYYLYFLIYSIRYTNPLEPLLYMADISGTCLYLSDARLHLMGWELQEVTLGGNSQYCLGFD